jgi:hypothetical protein
MSDLDQTEEPRRLLEIDANEVSLVDSPAIRRTFLVVKSSEKKDMAREELDLENAEDEDVATDSSQTEETENADPTKVMEAAADLLPWLRAQMQDAEGELRGQLSAFLEALGEDEMPEGAPEEEDMAEETTEENEEEKSEESAAPAEGGGGNWQADLDAVNETLSAAVSKEEGAEEEEDEEAEKSAENFVTTDQFETFAQGVTSALSNIATSMASVQKSVGAIESFTPVSKGADDVASTEEAEIAKRNPESALFSNLFKR